MLVLVGVAAAFAVFAPRASAQIFTPAPTLPVPTVPPTASAPSCHTVDPFGQPATLFAPGDRVVVKGDGFGGVSPIRVTFVQGTRTLPVGSAFSDELGVFSTDKGEPRIPATAAPGPASIHAFSSTKVTTCAVQVMAAAGGSATPQPKKKRSTLVLLWATVLAAFGLFLLVVLFRRWRAKRLALPDEGPGVPMLPQAPVRPDRQDDDLGAGPIFGDDPRPISPAPDRDPVTSALDDLFEPSAEPPPPIAPEEPAAVRLADSFADPRKPADVPFLDLLPEPEPPAEPFIDEPPRGNEPARDEDHDEFVFRDGKWRLRDQIGDQNPGVDFADASAVADALHVPAVDRDTSEPALLDPVSEPDAEEWRPQAGGEEAPPPAWAPDPLVVKGTVSNTVARLVEDTKDWTKR